jgi:DNA invertase Pin-like site-specific DNA recombinase
LELNLLTKLLFLDNECPKIGEMMKFTRAKQAKTVGYIRANDQDQDGANAFLEQVSRIRAAGIKTMICEFSSGSDDNRAGIAILLQLAEAKSIHAVVSTRWDRLTRSAHGCMKIADVFRAAKTRLFLLDKGEADLTPLGEHILASVKALTQRHDCQPHNAQALNADLPVAKKQQAKQQRRQHEVISYGRVSSREQAEHAHASAQKRKAEEDSQR